MASELPTLSRTDKNLWNAIVSEALAYLKYNAYAHKALEEGYPEVAQVFQEVAGAETIHGLNHLRVSGDIGSTEDNLRTVTISESREFTTMYPRMIQDAIAEDRAGRRRVLCSGPGARAAPPDGVHPGVGATGRRKGPLRRLERRPCPRPRPFRPAPARRRKQLPRLHPLL